MRIGFLLGAGVSIPAGMPTTSELTEEVLHVENYALHTDESFVRARPEILDPLSWETDRHNLKSFLEFVRDRCEAYFHSEKSRVRHTNYEDLFFAASQLDEHLVGEYENPALEAFTETVLAGQPRIVGREHLRTIVGLACNYIRDVVAMQLRSRGAPRTPGHLGCLVEALTDPHFDGCDVFTLNHDLQIEAELARTQVTFVDGFDDRGGDVAWWRPRVFNKSSRHYFLKLHGSINWLHYDGRLAKVFCDDADHARTSDGTVLSIPDRARVLIGTFNKIRDYFTTPYFDLAAVFRRQLGRIGTVIISGYSFGDKGVNTVLTDWMRAGTHRRMLILHARGDSCLVDARGAIRHLWDRFSNRRMYIHPEHLNACDWHELLARYLPPGRNETAGGHSPITKRDRRSG